MKRSFLSFTIVLIVSCMLTSCYSTRVVSKASDYTTAFVGKPHSYIVTQWGAPDRQVSDGAGGTILIYETITTTSNSVAAAYNVNYYSKTYTPGTHTSTSQSRSYVELFINKDAVCYNVKTNHTKVVEEKWSKKKIAAAWGWSLGGFAAFIGLLIAACSV